MPFNENNNLTIQLSIKKKKMVLKKIEPIEGAVFFELSLERTFHKCFLPSFTSFG
jgi:hypothetical protein